MRIGIRNDIQNKYVNKPKRLLEIYEFSGVMTQPTEDAINFCECYIKLKEALDATKSNIHSECLYLGNREDNTKSGWIPDGIYIFFENKEKMEQALEQLLVKNYTDTQDALGLVEVYYDSSDVEEIYVRIYK